LKLDVTSVIVALVGGGFVTGFVALLKFKPEKDAIVVTAAQGALVVQTGVMDALQEELDRARADSSALRAEIAAVRKEFAAEVARIRVELDTMRGERDSYRDRVRELERTLEAGG
jgi:hypothetical protein